MSAMEWLATQCVGNTKSGDIRVWGSKDSHRTSGEVNRWGIKEIETA